MTREEAIQVLRHIIQVADTSDCGIKEIDGIDEEALDMAIKALEQEPKWIPVSERLPENLNQEVLISLEWGIDIGRYSDGEWHSEWIYRYDDGNVLAWMPLPEPYEPQESEDKE